VAEIGPVIQKRKTGKPLTASDRKIVLQDAKERRARAIPIYFDSVEEKENFKRIAEKDGIHVFSKWAVFKLREVAKGDFHSKEYVDQLRKERDQLEKWYQTEKDKVAKLEREKDDLNRRILASRDELVEMAKKVRP
jgi:hypothetical protein